MVFPPPPTNTIDWANVGFKVRDVNGHIQCTYTAATGKWSEPKFVRDPYLRVHGCTPGLNYGQQCYEGLKAFRQPGDDRIAVFRPDQNALRMQHSAAFISIPPVPAALFERCVDLAVGLNAEHVPPHATGAAMYIRPLLFATAEQLGLNPPCDEYMFAVYVTPTGVYHGVQPIDCLILEDFDRAAPAGTGSAKIGGNYAPVVRWSEMARAQGYGITLHLDSKTRSAIDEFSTSGFIGARRTGGGEADYVLAVPDSSAAIKSVTSDSACDIARSLGWKVERREIRYDELAEFDEVMAAGTAASLVPVKSITMRSRGDKFEYAGKDGKPGPVITKLLAMLKGIQQGTVKDQFGWQRTVQEPKNFEAEGSDVNVSAKGSVDALP